MRVINLLTYSLLALAAAVVFCPLPLNGQSQSLNLRKQPVKAVAEQGTPERGRFQFIYSYSGDAIGATLTLTNNGTVVARQSGLAPVSADTLADITVARGDVLVATQQFGDSRNSLVLAPGLYGYPDGVGPAAAGGLFIRLTKMATSSMCMATGSSACP